MKWTVAALLFLSFAWVHGSADTPVTTLRVVTYNIHHGEGTDGVFDLPRIARLITRAQPDLVALQEVDENTRRSGGVNQLDQLAHLTGMHAAFGKTMNYDGGDYGVAVLSRWPILSANNEPLPSSLDREPRTTLTVRVQAGDTGPVLEFTCTHFDQGRDAQDRRGQAEAVNERETHSGVPAILAGDMNARPDTDVMHTLEQEWMDTTPAGDVALRSRPFGGDYVLFRPAGVWRLVDATVIDDRVASDHRPVLATLEWTGTR
jgi:endonuclease/exonuclease/phosphatase family metal-dependent hydrolase